MGETWSVCLKGGQLQILKEANVGFGIIRPIMMEIIGDKVVKGVLSKQRCPVWQFGVVGGLHKRSVLLISDVKVSRGLT